MIFFKEDFIYLRENERVRVRESMAGRGGSEGAADHPLGRKPDAGVDPGTPGS